MLRPAVSLFSAILLEALFITTAQGQSLSLVDTPRGVRISIDSELFAEYHTNSGGQPAVWPVVGPSNIALTRSYPIGPKRDDEPDDHPHHRSLWFAHGNVNGHDFWHEPSNETTHFIRHRSFEEKRLKQNCALLVTCNDWVANGQKVLEDKRTLIFAADQSVRWIDFKVELIASHGRVEFGDTKEGTFAIRVAGMLNADEPGSGHIVNSRGQRDGQAWGQHANWVDYYGSLNDTPVGIAIFSHPSNPRHPCRWHVRGYGLFAANPFGEIDFPDPKPDFRTVQIPAGKSLTLAYRVVLHNGIPESARLHERYQVFANASDLSYKSP